MIESTKYLHLVQNKDTHKYIPEDFKKVARGMETQFLEYMLKKMNDTVSKSAPDSTSNNYYKSLQTSERAKLMSQLGQEGSLKNLILNKIYPEKFRNEQAFNAYQKSQQKIYQENHIKLKE